MMGLEEHLLTMFRGDFEFHDGAAASHLGRSGGPQAAVAVAAAAEAAQPAAAAQIPQDQAPLAAVHQAQPSQPTEPLVAAWAPDATKELQKIPFFVRGKARRNTERFAAEKGLAHITVETLYDAKAHFGR
jgi:light-independent protochlorophyllide reductase subunit B